MFTGLLHCYYVVQISLFYSEPNIKQKGVKMGILELILGILLFLFLANFILALVPIPRGLGGTVVAILILVLIWRLVF